MNHVNPNEDELQDDLRFKLRGLRREAMPSSDLWPGIAARIEGQGDRPAAGGGATPLRRRGMHRFAPWALAASLVLAVGVAWQLRPDPMGAAAPASPSLVAQEADAMSREYDAALRELQAAGVAGDADAATLLQLDRSAAQIRHALSRDPDAHFLLDRLRSTYEKRLELTRLPSLT